MDEFLKFFAVALCLAMISERLVEAVIAPIQKRVYKTNPDYDFWWLVYVTWVVGGLLAWFSTINLFADVFPPQFLIVGRILTALGVGGGSQLLHDWFDNKKNESLEIITNEFTNNDPGSDTGLA